MNTSKTNPKGEASQKLPVRIADLKGHINYDKKRGWMIGDTPIESQKLPNEWTETVRRMCEEGDPRHDAMPAQAGHSPTCKGTPHYYDGALGYEAMKCDVCGYELDLNAEANAKATAERESAQAGHSPLERARLALDGDSGDEEHDALYALASAHEDVIIIAEELAEALQAWEYAGNEGGISMVDWFEVARKKTRAALAAWEAAQ